MANISTPSLHLCHLQNLLMRNDDDKDDGRHACGTVQIMVTLRRELSNYPTSIDEDVEILKGGLNRREAFAGTVKCGRGLRKNIRGND